MAYFWLSMSIFALIGCFPYAIAGSIWIGNFSRMRWVSSIVLHEKLYIDGGALYLKNNAHTYSLGSTAVIDLGQPWTPATVQFSEVIDKGRYFPFARAPYLWYNTAEKKLQSIGGYLYYGFFYMWMLKSQKVVLPPPYNVTQSLRELEPGKGKWVRSTEDPVSAGVLQYGAAVATSDSYYMLGSVWNNSHGTDYLLPGMVRNEFKGNVWHNISSDGYGRSGTGALGQALFTPLFGAKGIIIYIGGYTGPKDQIITQGGSKFLQDMFQIYIYDIESQKIMFQRTTGPTPPRRYGFMAVGVSESESGTFDIFIHGGFAATEDHEPANPDLAIVWVLSIPSFVWTRVPGSGASMRGLGTAQVAGQSQMVIVGGDNPTFDTINAIPDPWDNGIGIFDLNSWQWTTSYKPDAAAYTRAPTLTRQSKETPYACFDSNEVARVFDPQSLGNCSSDASSSAKNSSGDAANIAAIAGGIVGGVLGLACVAALAWYIARRKKRSKDMDRPPEYDAGGYQGESDSSYDASVELEHPPLEIGSSQEGKILGELEGTAVSKRGCVEELSPQTLVDH